MQLDSKKIITGLVAGLLLLFIIIIFTGKEKKENNILVDEDQKIEDSINQTDETQNNDEDEIVIEEGEEIIVDEEEIVVENKNENIAPETIIQPEPEEEKIEYVENSKEDLANKLQIAIDEKSYEAFASTLRKIYDSKWQEDEALKSLESKLYVTGTDYFQAGNIDEALKMANIISEEVFESWRFNYLKIICLEKYGRDEFAKGNYDKAEEYAMKILQIEFRPEGANLLGDIYIKKIEALIIANDKQSAQNNLNTIWDYEVDQTRRDKLNELKAEIESL